MRSAHRDRRSRRATLAASAIALLLLPASFAAAKKNGGSDASSYDDSSRASQAEQAKLRIAMAGKQAGSVADLTALVQSACNLQPWQFTITGGNRGVIHVERSPTLAVGEASCIYSVIGQSKFYIERN